MDRSKENLRIVIIAGPNGAGKTTFAREFLPNEADCPAFINADLIALGLEPFQPDKAAMRAGRLMLQEIRNRVSARTNFAFETTLSGATYAQTIPEWQRMGYDVKLAFLSLPDADMAVARVAARVAQGGHDVPEEVVRRRFYRGLRNFRLVPKLHLGMLVEHLSPACGRLDSIRHLRPAGADC